jgi:hypothetical protein
MLAWAWLMQASFIGSKWGCGYVLTIAKTTVTVVAAAVSRATIMWKFKLLLVSSSPE